MSDKYNITIEKFKLRREQDKMGKIIDAYNALHNIKDYNEQYKRNEDTYDMLHAIEIIQPVISQAFNEERNMFYNLMSNKIADMFNNNELDPEKAVTVRVGKWWEMLLGGLEPINTPSGIVKLEKDVWGQESVTYYEGEGYTATRDCDNIMVINR